MAQDRDEATRLRALIVVAATVVWIVSAILPVWAPKIPSEPGIGAAYMAVLAAALAFPEIERFRHGGRRRREDDDDSGKGDDRDD